jgi:hypothetical protein
MYNMPKIKKTLERQEAPTEMDGYMEIVRAKNYKIFHLI